MNSRRCVNCGDKLYSPKNISNQRYCAKEACQRVRKRKWEQARLRNDKDYRTYRKESLRRWRAANPHHLTRYGKGLASEDKLRKEKHRKIKILVEESALANLTKNGEINCICQIILKL
jgi:hypothetical protein